MKPYLRLLRLFDYDSWANNKVISVLSAGQEESLKHISHILVCQELWYKRIIGADLSDIEVWPAFTLKQCQEMALSWPVEWESLINKNAGDLDRTISYKNTSGNTYDTILSDILHHVIIHGQHHRAQIATLLRRAGATPPGTDFIFYTRQT